MKLASRRDGHGSAAIDRALLWIGAEVEPGRFFEGEHVARRITPFLLTGVLPFALLPALDISYADWRVGAAIALALAIVASILLLPWERLPAWTQALPVLAAFPVIALLRDTGGDNAATFEPLVVVPITWFALYGTRKQLFASIAAMAATLALPPVIAGPPTYESEQIVRAGIAAAIGTTVGVAVQALVAATRRFANEARGILESSQDAFVATDQEGTVVEWNAQAEQTFGWPRSQILGRSILDTIIRSEDRESAIERLRDFTEEGGTPPNSRFEGRGRRRDGDVFPLEMTVSRVKSGESWTFNSFIHDISERKRAQRALQEAEERFRRAFEDNRVGMAVIALDWTFARVNAAFCEMLGYVPEDLIGLDFPQITHADDIDPTMTAVEEIAAGRRYGFRTEKRCLHSDGRYIWTAVNVSPIRDGRGDLLHLIAQIEDITERKEQEAKLTHQAMHDPLTGLPNRVLFADRVRVASGRRAEGSFGVIYIDLDTFKPINDTFGHAAGDQILVEVSRRLEQRLRDGDTLARLGGDEFAVLCEDTDEAIARLVAERVIDAFAKPFEVAGREVMQAASIGVAVKPRGGRQVDPEEVLGRADVAMYRAKAAGKSRYAIFEGWMGEGQPDHGGLERDLRRALADGELTVHYQPEIDLASGEVSGAEALVRWEHPERGLLEPAEFMFVAEASDLIVGIDDFVLRQACHEASQWRRSLGGDLPFVISVNLSERRLTEPGLSNKIAQAIADADLPADSLCLEVAERAVLDRRGTALASLPDLDELGVRLLIDDFGIAISSFSAIQRMPRLSGIKIDSSFIAGIGHSSEDSVGVAAIVGLAHGLKLTATAEGVETAEQLAVLRELGCDRAQGFFFARPQPPASFAELLESARHGELLA